MPKEPKPLATKQNGGPRPPFVTTILTSAATTFILLVGAMYYFHYHKIDLTLSGSECWTSASHYICVFDDPLETDSMLSVLSSFYTNLIVILIAILTIVATLAALGIRNSAKQHIEDELPEVTESFFGRERGSKLLESAATRLIEPTRVKYSELASDVEKQRETLVSLTLRFDELQERLDNIDTGEIAEPPDQAAPQPEAPE